MISTDPEPEPPMPRDNEYLLYDPEYWQNKAEETYAQAASVWEQPILQSVLLRVAESYETLSQQALERKQARARWSRINPSVRATLNLVKTNRSA